MHLSKQCLKKCIEKWQIYRTFQQDNDDVLNNTHESLDISVWCILFDIFVSENPQIRFCIVLDNPNHHLHIRFTCKLYWICLIYCFWATLSIIKRSVQNTRGLIEMTHRPWEVCYFNWNWYIYIYISRCIPAASKYWSGNSICRSQI